MPGKWIKPKKRQRIYVRDCYTCYMCSRNLSDMPDMLTLDHVKPRSKGGCNSERNLATACFACNSARQDKPLTPELRQVARKLTRRKLPELAGV